MSLYVPFKIGNLFDPDDTPQKGALDLMPLCWSHEPFIGENTLKTFGVMELPDSVKPFIIDAIKPLNDYGNTIVPLNYRAKRKKINWDYLTSKINGSSSLYDNLKAKNVLVPQIDMRHVTDMDKLFDDSHTIDLTKYVVDLNIINGGDVTVGSGIGDDYANFVLLDADLGNLTSNCNVQQTTDVTDTARANFTISTNPYKLTIYGNATGDPTVGNVWSVNHTIQGLRFSAANMNFEIKNMIIDQVAAGVGVTTGCLTIISSSALDVSAHNIIFKGSGLGAGGTMLVSQVNAGDFYLMSARDCGAGIRLITRAGSNVKIRNNASENCSIGYSAGNFVSDFDNNWAFNNTTDFVSIGNATGDNNADSDGTGTDLNWSSGSNNQPNLTPANEVNLDDTDSDYLLPIAGQTIVDGGNDPLIFSEYMNGISVESPYPIGPKKLEDAGGTINLRGNLRGNLLGGFQ